MILTPADFTVGNDVFRKKDALDRETSASVTTLSGLWLLTLSLNTKLGLVLFGVQPYCEGLAALSSISQLFSSQQVNRNTKFRN